MLVYFDNFGWSIRFLLFFTPRFKHKGLTHLYDLLLICNFRSLLLCDITDIFLTVVVEKCIYRKCKAIVILLDEISSFV